MWTLVLGFASFVSLVAGLLAFRRYRVALGWTGLGLFVVFLLGSVAALWKGM